MARVAFNDDELEALWGLPWLPQLVYMRAIRPNMDYMTGVVGIRTSRTKRISYQAIREQVEVHEVQGRTGSEQVSMSALRNAIQTLVKSGLVERVSTHSDKAACLVFLCVLADVDSSVRNKYDRGTTGGATEVQQEERQSEDAVKVSSSNDSHEPSRGSTTEISAEVQQGNSEKCDTPPDTDLKTYTHKSRTRGNGGDGREKLPICPEFEIDAEVKAVLFRSMVPMALAEQLLLEFVNANLSSGHASFNWPAEFAKYCIQQKRYKESWESRQKPRNGLRLVSGQPVAGDGHGFNTED